MTAGDVIKSARENEDSFYLIFREMISWVHGDSNDEKLSQMARKVNDNVELRED